MAFVFYDTETTGLSAAFCQIVQFAAILTDDDLNEIERVNLRCRLRPHILPSPGALLVTGISPADLARADLPTTYELALQIRDLFRRWGPACFIGHNTIRFDEGFLRQLFYQSLLPAYVTNTGGSSRADTLIMARAFAALRPEFTVPTDENGKPVYKLEALAGAHGFGEFRAHDALADVEATAFIARRMKDIDPRLFDHLIEMGRKPSAQALATASDLVFLPATENGAFTLIPLGGLIDDPGQHARTVAVDLRHDPTDLLALDFEKPADPRGIKLRGRTVFRRLPVNNQPAILTAELCDADPEECARLSRITQDLRGDHEWMERVRSAMARSGPEYEESEHVEEQLYDGFPTSADQRRMDDFHQAPWPERGAVIREFEDPRWRQIGIRLLAEHYPDGLGVEARERYRAWLKDRLETKEERPWLTRRAAIAELESARAVGGASGDRLDAIARYITKPVTETDTTISDW